MQIDVTFFIVALICGAILFIFCMIFRRRVRKVLVKDIKIAYRQYGHGKPLILIGGYGSSMTVWGRSFLSCLSSHYRVIIFDNRGIGSSTLGTQPYTIEQCAEDTKGLIDALKLKEVYVFGYSMGASIAQELVLRHPSVVKKLILGGANSLGKTQMKPIVQRSLADLSGSDNALWRRKVKIMFPINWLKERPYILRLSVKFNREVMKLQINALEKWQGVEERLKNIKVSTLLIVGQEDIVTPPSNALFILQQIKGAWLVQFANCGHGLIKQEPSDVARIIKIFLVS